MTARSRSIAGATIRLVQGDIVEMRVDAIVNAANAHLTGGGGVDGAIHRAGGPSILQECRRIGRCATGSAVITGAGSLHARQVIHAVAPIYRGAPDDPQLLASAYRSALELALRHGLESIAFPSLGTGAYGYPVHEAAPIALRTVAAHARTGSYPREILFVLFSERDLQTYAKALGSLELE